MLVISTRHGALFGQFVIPKSVLVQQGILSKAGQGGKRALRVYPPWDPTSRRQTQNTQHWQLGYFLEIPHNKTTRSGAGTEAISTKIKRN